MTSNSMTRMVLVGAGCAAMLVTGNTAGEAADATAKNPLLEKWTGPYQGVPAFDKYKVEQFEPALEAGMAEQLAEVERIAKDPAAPTFENTIAALERAGRTLSRVVSIYGVYSSTLATPEFQAVEQKMAPRLAEFQDRIFQNEPLWKRIAAVYEARQRSGLTPEQQRLAWVDYNNFARSGAKLDPAAKKRLSEVNQRLATLFTTFSQNVLADETDYLTTLTSEKDLAGLPPSFVAAAAATAEERGKKGQWAIANTRSSMEPFLTYSDRRDLREKVWRTYFSRGDNGDAHDNKKIITEILRLRAERAKLLGYATHAHWRVEDQMARTPEPRDGPHGGGLEASGRPRPRGGRRHAGGGRQGGGEASRSSRGTTATTPRRCARPGTTSTRTRSSPTCSSRSCARGCSGWPGSSLASSSRR